MNIEKFAMRKNKAYKLWKEYVEACKKNPEDKFLKDMKKVYNQLKSGRKVIDIQTVFKRSGITHNFEPKLAIALATSRTVRIRYDREGTITFYNDNRPQWKKTPNDIRISDAFPELPESQWRGKYTSYKRRTAPVPKIPASIRPKGKLKNYFILWEVEKWEMIPPTDPYLLRRLTRNMFVVVAGWDLTPLEKAVMKGRVW